MDKIKWRAGGAQHNIEKKFVRDFRGMTMCVWFLEDASWKYRPERRPSSNVMIFVCRRVYDNLNEVYDMHPRKWRDNVTICLPKNHLFIDAWVLGREISLSSFWLKFCHLPSSLQEHIWHHSLPKALPAIRIRSCHPTAPWLFSTVNWASPPVLKDTLDRDLRRGVNKGSLSFVDSLPPSKCDKYQKRKFWMSTVRWGRWVKVHPHWKKSSVRRAPERLYLFAQL